MSRIFIALLLFCSFSLVGQSYYSGQIKAIEDMLEQGRYTLARAQIESLIETGRQSQEVDVVAQGNYLMGRALLEDPTSDAKERVAGIKALNEAAAGFREAGQAATVDSIASKLKELSGEELAAIENLPTVRKIRAKNPAQPNLSDSELDEATLNAIVALQSREIEALTDSQIRQLLLLQKKDFELGEYENKVLSDSVQLMRQQMLLDEQRSLTQSERQRRNFFIVLALGVLVALALLYLRYRSGQRYQEKLKEKNVIIENERQRSDELLLNILPVRVAKELKDNGKATARRYEDATVFFSDFVGFSRLAAQHSPEELISMLDETFRSFDAIIDRHGLEKIKTIGDAYMCVSGVPEPSADHATRAVRAALDIQRYLKTNLQFEARIGIHSGPVVAGVVGQKKFAYDIWGDTVNQAARLEAAGEKGQVTISRSTCELLDQEEFDCQHVGTFEAKNIGQMDRYVAVSRVLAD